jgi:Fe2+ or Zn2+ uptake regulation protein
MIKIWTPIPAHITVMEILSKKGALNDSELYKEVKKTIGDFSFRELNNVMLKLETKGFIKVSRLMKGKRRVEIKRIRREEPT